MPAHSTVRIQLAERSYDILIGHDLLDQSDIFKDLPKASSVLVVTNTTVAPLYAAKVQALLRNQYQKVDVLSLPDGEVFKTWETLQLIFDDLLQKSADRKTLLVALGGGVIGDMTGFAAACYMRGIPFVQVPTTLLSQVDSSVGGKTGINHPLGKNMVGAFYQPLKVICDSSTLNTLPAKELSAGLAEVIKYGPIADLPFLSWLEANIDLLIQKDPVALSYAIEKSCEIKAYVVGQDEKESGLRAILNFGHTFGHAIEAGMGYGQWLHGEAVGAGMVMAAHLSKELGFIDQNYVNRLVHLIEKAGLPIVGPVLDAQDNAGRYLELMRSDKKSEAGEIRFVLISGKGTAFMLPAPDDIVRKVIDRCCQSSQ